MLITILTFVIVLGVLVFVHELGHFITARRAGVKVDEFGLGFPPRAIGVYKTKEGRWKAVGPKVHSADSTIYSFNWLPLGGFVKIKGEQGENPDDEDSFGHKSIGKRIIIISAGVLMNVFLAFVLLSIGFKAGLPQVLDGDISKSARVENEKIQVVDVLLGLPAQRQGLQLGDSIVSVDSISFTTLDELQEYIDQNIGNEMVLTLERGGETFEKKVTPEILESTGRGGIGVGLVKTGIVSYPLLASVYKGAETTLFLVKEIIVAFYSLIRDLIFGRGVTIDISGPVGIAVITGEVARQGFIYILQFTALLSLNLAVINFLPFPALDGGRVVFLLLEKIRGKAVSARVEATMHNIGFALLMVLVVLVTYRDIFRFFE